jgi:3-hydroxyacyl-[acyl-carrier-protein] dehydratase
MKMQSAIRIAPDHPSFAGHFPKFPVLPGAILLDEVFEAIESARGIEIKSWHIASAKFLGMVRPGDSLLLEHDDPSPGLIRFTIRAGNRTVASGTLSNAREPYSMTRIVSP